MMDAQLYGLNPGGYHLTNVGIHALSAVLLFLILYRLTGCLWQSSFVSALFALHPLHVESVAWVAERKDVLSAFFWFLTLILYAAYVAKRKKSLYLLTLFSFVLGLMSKPMLVTLPVVLLLLDFWPLNRCGSQELQPERRLLTGSTPASLLKEKIPFFACSLISAVITVFAQHAGKAINNVSFELGAENAIVAYARYLAKAFWPHDLAIFYPLPASIPLWQAAGSLLVLLLVSAAALRTRRRYPFIALGWFWYLVTLVPVIGIIPVGGQSSADRYTYIPLIGIFIIIAWGAPILVRNLPYRKCMLSLLAGAVLTASAAVTWQQLAFWRDSVSLFGHAIQVTPPNHTIHAMMGNALVTHGQLAAATKEYEKSLRIKPDYARAQINLGIVHNLLGNDFAAKGNLEAAISQYRQALVIRPDDPETHTNLGNTLANSGNLDAAITEFRKVVTIAPDSTDAHNNLGIILAKKGNLDAAAQEFKTALALNPDSSEAQDNLQQALLTQSGPR